MKTITTILALLLFVRIQAQTYFKGEDVTDYVTNLEQQVSVIPGLNSTITNLNALNADLTSRVNSLIQANEFQANQITDLKQQLANCVEPEPPIVVKTTLEGFGVNRGAYAGSSTPTILYVNNLSGLSVKTSETSGSLRWCLEQTFPRIILVRKSGTITLATHIQVRNPYVSFFGQTGKLLVKGEGIDIRTHDVIIQHLIVRPGNKNTTAAAGGIDGIEIRRAAYNVVVDHCSVAWAIDENMSLWADEPIRNITISNCIIGEGLNKSIHPEGAHSKGLMVGTDCQNISLIKNYITCNGDRNPLMQGKTSTEVITNLIYNGGNQIMLNDFATLPTQVSIINNVYLRGPNETSSEPIKILGINNSSKVYAVGNTETANDWSNIDDRYNKESYIKVSVPPISSGAKILPRNEVKNYVFENVGAWYWDRDAVDKRLISEYGTGIWKDVPPDDINYPEINLTYSIPKNPHTIINGFTNLENWLK